MWNMQLNMLISKRCRLIRRVFQILIYPIVEAVCIFAEETQHQSLSHHITNIRSWMSEGINKFGQILYPGPILLHIIPPAPPYQHTTAATLHHSCHSIINIITYLLSCQGWEELDQVSIRIIITNTKFYLASYFLFINWMSGNPFKSIFELLFIIFCIYVMLPNPMINI